MQDRQVDSVRLAKKSHTKNENTRNITIFKNANNSRELRRYAL